MIHLHLLKNLEALITTDYSSAGLQIFLKGSQTFAHS